MGVDVLLVPFSCAKKMNITFCFFSKRRYKATNSHGSSETVAVILLLLFSSEGNLYAILSRYHLVHIMFFLF